MRKRPYRFEILTDAVLILCGALAVTCGLPTAFAVRFELGTLVFGASAAALLVSAWLHLKRGWVFAVLLVLLAAVGAYIDRAAVVEGASVLRYSLAEPLSKDFSFISVPAPLPELVNPGAGVTAFLMIVLAAVAAVQGLAIVKSRSVVLPLLAVVIPFLPSFIYTDKQPAFWTIVLLLVCVGGILTGHGLREAPSPKAGELRAVMLPLLAGLAMLLAVVFPEERFTPISYSQRQAMLGRSFGSFEDSILNIFKGIDREVELNKLGDRIETDERAFLVSASIPGSYLLRTHSYGRYEGGVWLPAPEYNGEWDSMEALGRGEGPSHITVSIRGAVSGERFVPYGFIHDDQIETGESFVRSLGRTAYYWRVQDELPIEPRAVTKAEKDYYIYFAKEQYVMPEGDERKALISLVRHARIPISDDDYVTALTVAEFVRNSAVYTLTPDPLPEGEDFVRYFLTEGHSGYCVHFASATTAILQALGIPARYTVGYSAEITSPNEVTEVTERSSHAWTEVYILGVGWVPVESTAGRSADHTGRRLDNVPSGYVPAATPMPIWINPVRPSVRPVDPERTPLPTDRPETTRPPHDPFGSEAPTPEPTKPPVTPVSPGGSGNKGSNWWLWLVIPAAAVGLFALTGKLVDRRRSRLFRQSDARRGIIEMSRYLKGLERIGIPPVRGLDALTDEAAFSNHPMNKEQRELFERVESIRANALRDEPLKRFVYRRLLFRI
ncbi:MAG: hypothetical protein IKG85_10290 [Clostridia bacterium]|nr:hypothetical protein [Clostridia bacterium]